MNILKWLLHPILVLIVIIGIAIYLNKSGLIPQEHAEEAVSVGIGQSSQDDSLKTSASDTSYDTQQEQAIEVQPSFAEGAPEQGVQDDMDILATSTASEGKPIGNESSAQASDSPIVSADETLESSQRSGSTGIGVVDKEKAVSIAGQGSTGPIALIESARAAVRQGEWTKAIDSYKGVIAVAPDNIGAHGELGDLYLYLGERDKAIQSYTQVAMILKDADEPMRAWRVVEFVWGLDPAAGSLLGEKLFQ